MGGAGEFQPQRSLLGVTGTDQKYRGITLAGLAVDGIKTQTEIGVFVTQAGSTICWRSLHSETEVLASWACLVHGVRLVSKR